MAVQGKQDTLEILNEYFHSGISDRKKTVDALINALIRSGIKFEIAAEELYLTIDEAVTNAMEHGNKLIESNSIEVVIEVNAERLTVTVCDEGGGFDYAAWQPATDILRERGRGILIMREFADRLEYGHTPDGRFCVQLTKLLTPAN